MAGQADPDYNMDESDSDDSETGTRYYCEDCDESEVFEDWQEALDAGWRVVHRSMTGFPFVKTATHARK